MHDHEFVFSHICGCEIKRPDFSCIPGHNNKKKTNTAKEELFALSFKRKQILQSSDVLLTLAGDKNFKKRTHFRVTEQNLTKNQHIYFPRNEIQRGNRHRCEF